MPLFPNPQLFPRSDKSPQAPIPSLSKPNPKDKVTYWVTLSLGFAAFTGWRVHDPKNILTIYVSPAHRACLAALFFGKVLGL